MIIVILIILIPIILFYLYFIITRKIEKVTVSAKIRKTINNNILYQITAENETFLLSKEHWDIIDIGKTYLVTYYGINCVELNLYKKIYKFIM